MDDRTKSTEMRLAEVIDIYSKLRGLGLLEDPDVASLREACRRYVRSAESSNGSCSVRSLGKKLRYDLRRRSGQPTYAVIKAGDESGRGDPAGF